ncbi:hypothetical protein [Allokutzneria albata]|uniref:Uncharacterized protein n=1 Tax=Allokutzneria albata TaxID=211114 RepID=A0A1H0DUB7_ALLAB|nr:hypothetical protein [Allokutzneria albata]SDN73762.1 hypothetical protein SAMN04489726_8000 [Allokutzneria albata]
MRGAIRSTALTGANQAVAGPSTLYRGITVRETAGAAAEVRVWDNASAASGVLLETVALAADGSVSLLHPVGIFAAAGVYVEVVSGAVEGSIRIG